MPAQVAMGHIPALSVLTDIADRIGSCNCDAGAEWLEKHLCFVTA